MLSTEKNLSELNWPVLRKEDILQLLIMGVLCDTVLVQAYSGLSVNYQSTCSQVPTVKKFKDEFALGIIADKRQFDLCPCT